LLEIYSHPANDDGLVVPPNSAAIRASLEWAVFLKSTFPVAPPTLVTIEPNGGIIISRRERAEDGSDVMTEFTFYNNSTAENTYYRNGRILHMDAMPIHPPQSSGRTR
jgi:hypothetical protein